MTVPIWLAAATLALGPQAAAGSAQHGAAAGDEARILAEVPRQANARSQLERAAAERAGLQRVARDQLLRERRRVALEYAAVRLYFPGERALAAEASFRAAELWRFVGESSRAAAELEQARVMGEGTEFRARALLELGHLERRRRRWSQALDRYLEVAGDAAARPHWRDQGAIWAGKTYAALGELDEARRQLVRVCEGEADPLVRAQAFDEWALTYLVTDDVEGAAGVLARCRDELAEFANEATELGRRLRLALSRLRCIAAIERAVAKRRGAPAFHQPGDDEDGDE